MSQLPQERRLVQPVLRNAVNLVLAAQPLVKRDLDLGTDVVVVDVVALQELIPVVLESQLTRPSPEKVEHVPQV